MTVNQASAESASSGLHVAVVYDCLYPISIGGGERVYRRMAERLGDRCAHVDYVTRRHWGEGRAPTVATASVDVVAVWSGEIYDASGTRTPSSALRFAWSIFRHFRSQRGKYDLAIVSALPVLNVFAVRSALIGTRTRLVADWLEVWTYAKWRRYAGTGTGTVGFVLQVLALRLGWLHTANSRFTANRIRRYRRSARPLVLGLIDLADSVPDATTRRQDGPFGLFVGRHIADKQVMTLPAAIADVRSRIPGFRFVIAGCGPQTEEIHRLVAESRFGDAVQVVGRVSDEALSELMSKASVHVNPSAREGFGLVVAEAAAHGTPSVVVAGDGNAAAELVVDGVNGYIARSTEPVQLADSIVRVLEGETPYVRALSPGSRRPGPRPTSEHQWTRFFAGMRRPGKCPVNCRNGPLARPAGRR